MVALVAGLVSLAIVVVLVELGRGVRLVRPFLSLAGLSAVAYLYFSLLEAWQLAKRDVERKSHRKQ